MTTTRVNVQRLSTTSKKPFESVMAAIHRAIGHPDMGEFSKQIAASKSFADIEKIVEAAIGPSGFMEFVRFDLGRVLDKKSIHLVIGNPLIMQAMVRHVPDAGSYAPVTVLIDERPDGVHLSYNNMASLLAPYENLEALEVARDLDNKVTKLLTEAAGN